MYETYLLEKQELISKILKTKPWISSYQIFLQSHKQLILESDEEVTQYYHDKVTIGGNISIISNNSRLIETSFAISELDKLKGIEPPKSTTPIIPITSFPELKKPHSKSIPGDTSKITNMKQNPNQEILNKAIDLTSDYEIPFLHNIRIQLENRLIHNSQDMKLTENTLKTDYKISTQFDIHSTNYILERSRGGRTVELNLEDIILDLVQSTILRIKLPTQNIPDNPAILFHPKALSKLLHNFFTDLHLIDTSSFQEPWSEEIQVYDDPLRSGGYYSALFDDEGTLSKPIQVISDGRINEIPKDLKSSNWKLGGNGYRVEEFQPNIRSYKYNVKPSITNLIVTGGNGRGSQFVMRPGEVLVIRKAYSFSRLGNRSLDFILHVNEAELYKNGDSLGPVDNLSIVGNLKDIMQKGHMSSDLIESVDSLEIGSFYTGWLIVPPSTVVLRS